MVWLSATKFSFFSYLSGRSHRTNIKNSYNNYLQTIFGAPQDSIIGLFVQYLYNWHNFSAISVRMKTDENTPYIDDTDLNIVISKLKHCTIKLFKWFEEKHWKSNCDKWHLLVKTDKTMSVITEGKIITSSQRENLLGIKLNSTLLFQNHVTNLCKKASKKLHALATVLSYMDVDNYSSLFWMFHSWKLKNQLNNIHEKGLRLTYNDNHYTFR